MTKEEFYADQITRKGYVCPLNKYDTPNQSKISPMEYCPYYCPHWGADCIVFGKGKISQPRKKASPPTPKTEQLEFFF